MRGRPKKEKNLLDINLNLENSNTMNILEAKTENKIEDNSHLLDYEEIVSPDGKYKTRRDKKIELAEFIGNAATKLPKLERAGYVIKWPTDAKPEYLTLLIKQGWDYVREGDIPGVSHDQLKIPAGKNKDGSTWYHYAMQISVDLYNQIETLLNNKNKKFFEKQLDRKLEGGKATEYNSLSNAITRGVNLIG
jgi:hypothetical protein